MFITKYQIICFLLKYQWCCSDNPTRIDSVAFNTPSVLASLCYNSFNETKRPQSSLEVALHVFSASKNKMACIFLRNQEFHTRNQEFDIFRL